MHQNISSGITSEERTMRHPHLPPKQQAKTKTNSLAAVLGATFLASTVMPMASAAATRPFIADELRTAPNGVPVVSYHVQKGRDGDSSEGGCGEGSCGEGASSSSEGGCGEGSCGDSGGAASASGEGSCGEGGCGGNHDAKAKAKANTQHGAASGSASDEGGCGEGRCG